MNLRISLGTIFGLSNGMIGSAAIVLPVLYFNYGYINALIISSVICMTSCKTALLIAENHIKEENDYSQTVERILGSKWKILFNTTSIFLLFACALINMILVCSLIYPIISQIIKNTAIQSDFTLTRFSYQWLGIIYTLIMLPFFFIKNIAPLLKLLSYGAVSIFLSLLFLIIKGSLNQNKSLNLYSTDFSVLPGVFGLAFMGHSLIVPILHDKQNRKARRDIIIAYIWTFIVYQVIGLFGSLAMNDAQKQHATGSTILDYFPEDDYLVLSLQILIFVQLSLAFPVIQFVTRARFFELLTFPAPKWAHIVFSICFSLCCLTTQLLNANLTQIISITGYALLFIHSAIIGLFLVYIIPTCVHIQNNYRKHKVESLLNDSIEEEGSKSNNKLVYIGYGLLNLFGLGIMVTKFL